MSDILLYSYVIVGLIPGAVCGVWFMRHEDWRILNRTELLIYIALTMLLIVCCVFVWPALVLFYVYNKICDYIGID